MTEELQDFELGSVETESAGGDGGPRSPRWPWVVGVIVVLALAIASYLWFTRRPQEVTETPVTGPTPSESAPDISEPLESTLEIGELPALAKSDTWLREIVGQLSAHPQLAEWMLTNDLIRRFVVVVDNIAEGTAPRKHLAVLRPHEGFGIQERNGQYFVDPVTYHRYDLLVDVVDSLDPQGVAELYRAIRPLCQQAYRDLGYPAEQFDDAVRRAVQRLLAAPVVEGPVELEPRVTAYEFRDPALENLSPATKQFLRLGPDNLQRLQAKSRELAQAIGVLPEG